MHIVYSSYPPWWLTTCMIIVWICLRWNSFRFWLGSYSGGWLSWVMTYGGSYSPSRARFYLAPLHLGGQTYFIVILGLQWPHTNLVFGPVSFFDSALVVVLCWGKDTHNLRCFMLGYTRVPLIQNCNNFGLPYKICILRITTLIFSKWLHMDLPVGTWVA